MLPVEKIISGGAILFLGAGFSVGAKNYSDNSIYSGAQLKDKLLKDCDIQDVENYDLETASDEYEHKYGTEALIKLLSENFRASSTCDYHTTIVCQPWKRIYTSNYDDVIEVSAKIGKKQIINKEVSDSVEAPLNNVTQVVHIYGNLSRISKAEFKHNFLLSESQRDIGFFFALSVV